MLLIENWIIYFHTITPSQNEINEDSLESRTHLVQWKEEFNSQTKKLIGNKNIITKTLNLFFVEFSHLVFLSCKFYLTVH